MFCRSLRGDGHPSFRSLQLSSHRRLAGTFLCDCGFGDVSTDASGARPELVGFGTLYFGRVAREERMMLETFGDSYRAHMARTGRVFPWISEEVPIDLWDRPGAKSLNFSAISAPYGKKRLSGLPTPRTRE